MDMSTTTTTTTTTTTEFSARNIQYLLIHACPWLATGLFLARGTNPLWKPTWNRGAPYGVSRRSEANDGFTRQKLLYAASLGVCIHVEISSRVEDRGPCSEHSESYHDKESSMNQIDWAKKELMKLKLKLEVETGSFAFLWLKLSRDETRTGGRDEKTTICSRRGHEPRTYGDNMGFGGPVAVRASHQAIFTKSRAGAPTTYSQGSLAVDDIYGEKHFTITHLVDDDGPISDDDAGARAVQTGAANPGGTVCRVVDFAPRHECATRRGENLDYAVVIEGSIVLTLESGQETRLERGDVAVQRATSHLWRNPSGTEWARMFRPWWLVVAGFDLSSKSARPSSVQLSTDQVFSSARLLTRRSSWLGRAGLHKFCSVTGKMREREKRAKKGQEGERQNQPIMTKPNSATAHDMR
ncbi:hypothetical protein L249_8703 [Ophiocordyceps polyrhachis-furcata BCC 54312]|uniref:Uncharacterized protein n=1 Tax=Ophiocordyceps polyrhachis-furcata BCC 54312 TaxID=1330021 RepID=A0A367L747_9HYPO|nr:hypothetical protein L249_8703 [Ophiocordyceps polyrhachis-furcata BCC 54312]